MHKIALVFSVMASTLYFILSTFLYLNLDSMPTPDNSALGVALAVAIFYGLIQPMHLVLVVMAVKYELEEN